MEKVMHSSMEKAKPNAFVTLIVIFCMNAAMNSVLAAAAVPAFGPTTVNPAAIPAAASTRVMVTSTIVDPSLIPGSVTLQRVDITGRVLATLGAMKDDATNGDQVAGDKTYTLQFSLTEPAGTVLLRVSAAFRSNIKRAYSGVLTINVTGATTQRLSTDDADIGSGKPTYVEDVPFFDSDLLTHRKAALDDLFVSELNDPAQLIDFESFADLQTVTTVSGATFTNTIALQSGAAGGSLNEFEFPPKSPVTVGSDNGGAVTITFANRVRNFSAYFTYLSPLVLEAFDGNNLVVSKASQFNSNVALSGDPGSSPNELLATGDIAAGFTKVRITGDPAGGSFVMDNVLFTVICSQQVNDKVNFAVTGTTYSPTVVNRGPAGTFAVDAVLSNKNSQDIFPVVKAVVSVLTGNNILLTATEGTGGVGSKQSIDVGASLKPGQSVSTRFVIGLQERKPFNFNVNVEGCLNGTQ